MSGCAICFGDDAAAVHEAQKHLERVARVVDESHFGVWLRRCAACGQRFASVFCERIDWTGGNDPQDLLLIPLDEDEAGALVGNSRPEGTLRGLSGRRYLAWWFGRDATAPDIRFVNGTILMPPHD